ncbi:MAG: methyltransferase, partial [Actinobacteria bacterium]|nr:methyltransferase [Actinomycetota bacterium]
MLRLVARANLKAKSPTDLSLCCPRPKVTNALARDLYPAAYPQLEKFVHLLETDGVTRGLIGPNEGPRLWERHIVNCALVEALVPVNGSVVDMGSGAGLPGLVLALVRPDITVSLVDTQARRVRFLTEAIEQLGLESRCTGAQGRFPEAWGAQVSLKVGAVVARGLAPLTDLVGLAWPAVREGA